MKDFVDDTSDRIVCETKYFLSPLIYIVDFFFYSVVADNIKGKTIENLEPFILFLYLC